MNQNVADNFNENHNDNSDDNQIEDSQNNHIGKNFLFSLAITIIIGCVNVAYPIVIGLISGPEIIGKFSVIFYYSTLIAIPIANGIAPALSRFIAANSVENENQIELICYRMSIFYTLISYIIFAIINYTIIKLSNFDFFIILSLLTLIIFHYLFRKFYQGKENFRELLIIELVSFAIFLPFMVIFYILPHYLNITVLDKFYFLFFPQIIYHFIFDIWVFLKKRKILFTKPSRDFFKFPSKTKNILKYAVLVGSGSLFALGTSQVQIIISEIFLTEFQLGVLSFWNSAMAPILLLAITLSSILVPRITNIIKSKTNLEYKFIDYLNRGLLLLLYPIVGFFFTIIAAYPELLDFITLSKYDMVTYWLVTLFLCFQAFKKLLTSITISFYSSTEKNARINTITSFIYSLIVSIIWVILVPRYGIFGFAGGLAIGGFIDSVLTQIIALFISKKKIGKHVLILVIFDIIIIASLLIIQYWIEIIGIIFWVVILIPSIIFGIRYILKVMRNIDFSRKYKSSTIIEE